MNKIWDQAQARHVISEGHYHIVTHPTPICQHQKDMSKHVENCDNSCSRIAEEFYVLLSTAVKKIYLTSYFVQTDDGDGFRFELHCVDKKQNRHNFTPLSIETLTHLSSIKACGECQDSVKRLIVDDGDVRIVDNSTGEEISPYKRMQHLASNILEDVELVAPYLGRRRRTNCEPKEVDNSNVLKRLFFAFVRDLHERRSYNLADTSCAAEVLYTATPYGFARFLMRCRLIYNNTLDMETIIGDGSAILASMIKPEVPPTARVLIHYARCMKCEM